MRFFQSGVWQNRPFLHLWSAQTVSLVGTAVSFLALPLTAVLVLDATPTQMGILTAIGSLPALVLGLFAGVVVDRRRKRPLMIIADVGRGGLLLLIPILAWAGVLHIVHLYVIGLLVGTLTLFFNVAYRAYLPVLVADDELVEANSKLELSRTVAEIAGPSLAGALIQLLTAPIAMGLDALSFFVSGAFLGKIELEEAPPSSPMQQEGVWKSIREGVSLVWANRTLRSIAGSSASLNFFNAMLEAVLILYLTNQLGIEPGLQGIIFATGSVGFLLGAMFTDRLTRRWGNDRSLIIGIALTALGDLLVPLAAGSKLMIVLMLIVAQPLFGFGLTLFNINQISLQQAVTPSDMMGRVNATMRFVMAGLIPLGALAGGLLGDQIGLRSTLFIAVVGEFAGIFWFVFLHGRMSKYG